MELEKIEKEAIEICREVGEFIRAEGESFDRGRIEQKNVFNNLVSYVDKESEKALVKNFPRQDLSPRKALSNSRRNTSTIGLSTRLMARQISSTVFQCTPSASA
jgi:hypothetical protein